MNFSAYILVLTFFSISASAEEIQRNGDGSVKKMNHYDAMRACPEGKRLPTARDVAIESQSRGAKGVLEITNENKNRAPKGYVKISAINPNGEKDEFYFNFEGYKRLEGDLGENWFWLSSVSSSESDYACVFFGDVGGVGDLIHRHNSMAVRCVDDR